MFQTFAAIKLESIKLNTFWLYELLFFISSLSSLGTY